MGCALILVAYLPCLEHIVTSPVNCFHVNSDIMFSLEEFIKDPQIQLATIKYAKKSQLLQLAAKYQLEVRKTETKEKILNDILQYCIDENLVTQESAKDFIVKESKDVEYMKQEQSEISDIRQNPYWAKLWLKV